MKVENSKKAIRPILKWVGGKRQLLDEISRLIPPKFNWYLEPFVGGAAVLLAILPNKAIINDLNKDLLNICITVKTQSYELLELLKKHQSNNSKEYFYYLRNQDRDSDFRQKDFLFKASRLIYLNKTCFNGLYRVNKQGHFNSPYGYYKNPNIANKESILELSSYLNENHIEIFCRDYKEVLKVARNGDFVYLDPPYMPISKSSSFTNYTKEGFTKQQQIELKEECDKLHSRGVKFLLSNSDHELIRELFKEYKIKAIQAKRLINSVATKRGKVNEVLIWNYDLNN
ncbi:DNA adenine methylase [Mycoplasma sp. 3341]|uniref:DNA adenine methylase n=1 Tax=Mycoplasma sp. 3341 TaxID=3447506 RepID=UPI003F65CE49